jgi:hypothetical protein
MGRIPGRQPQTMPRFTSIATIMKIMAPLSEVPVHVLEVVL